MKILTPRYDCLYRVSVETHVSSSPIDIFILADSFAKVLETVKELPRNYVGKIEKIKAVEMVDRHVFISTEYLDEVSEE